MESKVDFNRKENFICGVVEGFYGRPWTTEQRKDLFQKMKKWGMDSYLYAPKDDYKHRAYWRELYTVEEADHLSSLVATAKENDIKFIYAISPGLDIAYSSAKDVTALKRKLEQVNQLGCDAFAILFDDIDPEMSKADKEMFKSFAHAQVSVTNEAFQHINVSQFLFCPTQYCATRAAPNVRSSEYLKTIGAKLDLRIDIMWTGPKVISKDVTLESIEEVSEVIRRPPVIWDNLHANDYDQKRIFLGPYSGRSPQIIPQLRGVLTNPNCEYGANFVAIHTLAQWSRCSIDAKNKIEESMNPDAKLETENEDGNSSHVPENLDPHVYHPVVALKAAIQEWLFEFTRQKQVWGPMVKPQIVTVPVPLLPSVNTCISMTTTTNTTTLPSELPSTVPSVPTVNCSARALNAIVESGANSIISSATTTVMNSLVADNKIICADSVQAVVSMNSVCNSGLTIPDSALKMIKSSDCDEITQGIPSSELEPMDCNTATPPNPSPPEQMVVVPDKLTEDVLMLDSAERTPSNLSSPDEGVESCNSNSVMNLDNEVELTNNSTNMPNTPSSTMQVETQGDEDQKGQCQEDELTVDDILLLCDLFYLPYEHGVQGLQILHEFQWLKSHSNIIAGISTRDKSKPEVMEWYERRMKFEDISRNLDKLFRKLNNISNKELLYELYPYVWDIRGVVSLLNSYIKWLGFSKGWREAFSSGDQEPWVIRGGLIAELQRLIPVDRGTDLYIYKAPDVPSSRVFTVRPYNSNDEEAVYKVCSATFKDGLNAAEDFIRCPNLPGDLILGGFLSHSGDLSFVVEDENKIVLGIAVAVANGKELRKKLSVRWMAALREKYPMSTIDEIGWAKEVLSTLHSDMRNVSEELTSSHPAELRVSMMTAVVDPSVPKRLMTCVLAALRANGVFGCFVEVPVSQKYLAEFYKKLGFTDLYPNFMGRVF